MVEKAFGLKKNDRKKTFIENVLAGKNLVEKILIQDLFYQKINTNSLTKTKKMIFQEDFYTIKKTLLMIIKFTLYIF